MLRRAIHSRAAWLILGACAACARDVPCRSESAGSGAGVCATCPRASSRDSSGRCACRAGTTLLLGACVDADVADAYCGRAARPTSGGCELRACASPERLDVSTGECVPVLTLRELATELRIGVFPDETLGCVGDRPPVVEGSQVSCLPEDALCPRGARFSPATPGAPARCAQWPACAPGELPAEDVRVCSPVVRAGTVDVARWARAVIGPDGGLGSPSFCGAFAMRPAVFSLDSRSMARLAISVALSFPNNDVSQVYAQVDGVEETTARPLSSAAAGLVDEATRTVVEALRALGGEASAATVRTRVTCFVRTADRPTSSPR